MATPTNLTAAGLVIRYWRPDLNVGIWIAVFGCCIIAINVRVSVCCAKKETPQKNRQNGSKANASILLLFQVLNVKYFGEFEFWMASAKVS